jgi:hypothetical protein
VVDASQRAIKSPSFLVNINRIGLARIEENASATNLQPAAVRFEDFANEYPEPLFLEESPETNLDYTPYFHMTCSFP